MGTDWGGVGAVSEKLCPCTPRARLPCYPGPGAIAAVMGAEVPLGQDGHWWVLGTRGRAAMCLPR